MYVCISSYLIAIVKIKETSFKMESGSPERGLSATALPPLADLGRKKCTLYLQTTRSLHILVGGREIFSWPSNSPANKKTPHLANEKSPPPSTHALLQWTFILNNPSQPPPFLYKSMLVFFVLQACLWHDIVCLCWLKFLCYSQTNFAGKITSYFIFKVDISWCQKWDPKMTISWGNNDS